MALNRGGMTGGWRAGAFAHVVLASVLATAITIGFLVLMRRIAWVTDLRFDLTAEGTYAVAPEDTHLLRGLEVPVHATFIWGFDADIQQRVLDAQGEPRSDLLWQHYRPVLEDARRRVQRVLDEWSHVSPHFTYAIIDGETEPRRAEAAAEALAVTPEEALNRVILVQGSNRREVPIRRMMRDMQWGSFPPWPGAQMARPVGPGGWSVAAELGSAVRTLNTGERTRIGIVAGLNGFAEPGSEMHRILVRTLEAEGCQCESLELGKTADLSAFTAIIVAAPRMLLDRKSLEHLRAREANGGRFLLLADPRFGENYTGLLEPYGAVLQNVMIEDRTLAEPTRSGPAELQSMRFCVGRHPIDAPLKDRVPLYLGLSRSVLLQNVHAHGVEQTALLCASQDAESVPVRLDATKGVAEPLPAERKKTPAPILAAALSRKVHGGAAESRIVLFGSAGLLAPDEMTLSAHFGNRDCLLNCMSWLTDRPFAAPTTARAEARVRLVSVASYEKPVRWIGVICLPLFAMATALAVWFARRSM